MRRILSRLTKAPSPVSEEMKLKSDLQLLSEQKAKAFEHLTKQLTIYSDTCADLIPKLSEKKEIDKELATTEISLTESEYDLATIKDTINKLQEIKGNFLRKGWRELVTTAEKLIDALENVEGFIIREKRLQGQIAATVAVNQSFKHFILDHLSTDPKKPEALNRDSKSSIMLKGKKVGISNRVARIYDFVKTDSDPTVNARGSGDLTDALRDKLKGKLLDKDEQLRKILTKEDIPYVQRKLKQIVDEQKGDEGISSALEYLFYIANGKDPAIVSELLQTLHSLTARGKVEERERVQQEAKERAAFLEKKLDWIDSEQNVAGPLDNYKHKMSKLCDNDALKAFEESKSISEFKFDLIKQTPQTLKIHLSNIQRVYDRYMTPEKQLEIYDTLSLDLDNAIRATTILIEEYEKAEKEFEAQKTSPEKKSSTSVIASSASTFGKKESEEESKSKSQSEKTKSRPRRGSSSSSED